MSLTLRLTDADGHVVEDEPAIAQRLSGGYRRVQVHRTTRGPHPVLGGIFPPLDHLSTMPIEGPGMIDFEDTDRLTGDTPDSWAIFLDAVGIERTVLYPTVALSIGRVRDLATPSTSPGRTTIGSLRRIFSTRRVSSTPPRSSRSRSPKQRWPSCSGRSTRSASTPPCCPRRGFPTTSGRRSFGRYTKQPPRSTSDCRATAACTTATAWTT